MLHVIIYYSLIYYIFFLLFEFPLVCGENRGPSAHVGLYLITPGICLLTICPLGSLSCGVGKGENK